MELLLKMQQFSQRQLVEIQWMLLMLLVVSLVLDNEFMLQELVVAHLLFH